MAGHAAKLCWSRIKTIGLIVPTHKRGLIKTVTTSIAAMSIVGFTGLAQGFDLQGHRGARGLLPENSLPGFAKALTIGVSTLELDLAVTKDNQVVVIHNPRFEPEIARNAQGDWLKDSGPAINALTLAEVTSFDIGRLNPALSYAKTYPNQKPIDGTRVPTLSDVFELVRRSGNEAVHFNIETKISPEEPELTVSPKEFVRITLDVINKHGMQDRVALQSFDWRTLREVQHLAPDIPTSYLTVNQNWRSNTQIGEPGPSPWMAGFDVDNFGGSAPRAVKAAGGAVWSSYYREVDAASIALAHELGLLVKVWTVNDPAQMKALIDMGVDGIITDYPDILRSVLQESGIAVPDPTPVSP